MLAAGTADQFDLDTAHAFLPVHNLPDNPTDEQIRQALDNADEIADATADRNLVQDAPEDLRTAAATLAAWGLNGDRSTPRARMAGRSPRLNSRRGQARAATNRPLPPPGSFVQDDVSINCSVPSSKPTRNLNGPTI